MSSSNGDHIMNKSWTTDGNIRKKKKTKPHAALSSLFKCFLLDVLDCKSLNIYKWDHRDLMTC